MLKKIKELIILKISSSLKTSYNNNDLLLEIMRLPIILEIPPNQELGDFSSPISMQLAKIVKKSPREIANTILKNLPKGDDPYIKNIAIAGAGYINFYLNNLWLKESLLNILEKNENYGKSTIGQGKKVQIEFVSANPTGPLHIGHGRGAAIGDTLANILKLCEYEVVKEYYINDVGNQMKNLGKSTQSHYYQILGNPIPFPENTYQGAYIKEIAQSIIDNYGNKYLTTEPSDSLPFFSQYTGDYILNGIKKDLENFGVNFDIWFRESSLHNDGTVDKMLKFLKEKNFIYEKDGALWLASTKFGDDKDRVVISKEGKTTYLASDIAYHYNKFNRGFSLIINIWGADHHGYIPRIKATVAALGYNEASVHVILYQLVNLLRDGKPVAMSTRTGEYVELKDVINEIGKDVSRFYFLMRTSDSHLDFDLELAKKQSMENPVYYIQYAYARISSIFNEANKKGINFSDISNADISLLNQSEEIDIIKKLTHFPEIIELSALNYEPHRIINFLQELAGIFHPYYNKYRIINEEKNITLSRLLLIKCIYIVFKNALNILGVNTPERM